MFDEDRDNYVRDHDRVKRFVLGYRDILRDAKCNGSARPSDMWPSASLRTKTPTGRTLTHDNPQTIHGP